MAGPTDAEEAYVDRVTATDMRRLAECPLQLWYGKHNPHEGALPTLGLAVGYIEHAVRAEIARDRRKRIINAGVRDDLMHSADAERVTALVRQYFVAHHFVGVFGNRAQAEEREMCSRIIHEDEARSKRAFELWGDGLREADLANAILPFRVEIKIHDAELGLVGIPDEVWLRNGALEPMELKTTPYSGAMQPGHLAQVACYALLLERQAGRRVQSAAVHYVREGKIERARITNAHRRKIIRDIERVRGAIHSREPLSATPVAAVCEYCPFQGVCPESLAPPVVI